MTNSTISITDQLGAAKLTIDASLADPGIKELVGAYGYNDQKLTVGKQLYETAHAAVTAQGIAESAQLAASDALAAAKTQAVDAYQALAKVARATLPASALPTWPDACPSAPMPSPTPPVNCSTPPPASAP